MDRIFCVLPSRSLGLDCHVVRYQLPFSHFVLLVQSVHAEREMVLKSQGIGRA